MRQKEAKIASAALRLFFPLALGIAFLAAIYIRFYSGWIPLADHPAWHAYTAYFVISATLWSVLETRFGLIYRCFEEPSLGRWMASLLRLDLLTLAIVSLLAFFWRGYSFSRYTVLLFWGFHAALCGLAAILLRYWARTQSGNFRIYLYIVGEDLPADAVREECLPAGMEPVVRRCRNAAELLGILEHFDPPANCREIVVAAPASGWADLTSIGETLRRLPVPAALAVQGPAPGEPQVTGSFVVFSTEPSAVGAFDYVFSKRLMDLLLASLSFVLLALPMAMIAAAIWLRSGSPVLFTQERVGRGGRRFRLYKFRTLPLTADGDHRWTPPDAGGFGRFLRGTGLDELPQLFNVIKGEMSLVGPRPERPYFAEQFRRQLPFYSTRHHLQVGITGWAQVNGWRGDTSIPQRVAHDLYYLRHWSLALDFRILCMTVADLFRRLRGAPHARSV